MRLIKRFTPVVVLLWFHQVLISSRLLTLFTGVNPLIVFRRSLLVLSLSALAFY